MIVVAAALVQNGRLLAARRSRPAHLAGGWEFPGGKVEQGEDDASALVRECSEELGVDIGVGARLGEGCEGDLVIRLYAASLRLGIPRALEDHDALRWLGPDDLTDVDWLPLDAALLEPARAHLLDRIQSRE